MRLLAWRNWGVIGYCKVYLDGADITNDCFFADEEQGCVRCFARDTSGEKTMTKRLGRWDRYVKHGEVKIVLDEGVRRVPGAGRRF